MSAYRILGVAENATAAEIRAARRELARTLHPDAGGSAAAMQQVNAAATEALARLHDSTASGPPSSTTRPSRPPRPSSDEASSSPVESEEWVGSLRDAPSFTIEALPVEAFEALLVAAAELGEIEDDDPPYELRTLLAAPLSCWCQLDLVPDAGASTVSVSLAAGADGTIPSVVAVRNAWIEALNALDWSTLGHTNS